MRWFVFTLAGSLIFSGCSLLPSAPPKNRGEFVGTNTFSPEFYPVAPPGRVSMVNAQSHFVVMTFPIGAVPPKDRLLNVYRDNTKIGEVKVTGPQRDNNTVGDILSGNLRLNDVVRED